MSENRTENEPDLCEVDVFDPERVARVREAMLPASYIDHLTQIFQALGNPTRVKILHSLFTEELCVCDLAQVLGMSSSAVSHQLRLLRAKRLVKFRKEGKMAYYSIDDVHVRTLFTLGLEHVRHR